MQTKIRKGKSKIKLRGVRRIKRRKKFKAKIKLKPCKMLMMGGKWLGKTSSDLYIL